MGVLKGFWMLLWVPVLVRGHGRLVDPPSRSTMWRFGFKNPANYNDNQLYCGGVQVQYEQNGGKCGVCGDPWQGPRDNEPGGRYANGIIVRKYEVGDVIEAVVELTASHKGYFEFRLCQNNNPNTKVTQSCFDRHLLKTADTNEAKYYIPSVMGGQMLRVRLRLPPNVRCKACVFQWKYNAGNSWGTDPITNRGCLGCGNQEQFYGCADIAIGYDDITIGTHRSLPADEMPEDRSDDNKKPPVPDRDVEKDNWNNNNDNNVDKTDYASLPPPIPDWSRVTEKMEDSESDWKSVSESGSFQFLSGMQGMPKMPGMKPCMCVCKKGPLSLKGGAGGALDVKILEESQEHQVCMCMCQNSSSNLKSVPLIYFIAAFISILIKYALNK